MAFFDFIRLKNPIWILYDIKKQIGFISVPRFRFQFYLTFAMPAFDLIRLSRILFCSPLTSNNSVSILYDSQNSDYDFIRLGKMNFGVIRVPKFRFRFASTFTNPALGVIRLSRIRFRFDLTSNMFFKILSDSQKSDLDVKRHPNIQIRFYFNSTMSISLLFDFQKSGFRFYSTSKNSISFRFRFCSDYLHRAFKRPSDRVSAVLSPAF